MNARNLLLEQVQQLTDPVLAEHGVELVDLQFVNEHGQWVLRYFIDKEKGVTLDDCATLSEHVGRVLDAANTIEQSYSLEVSSPGINRPLKKESDFQRFVGERVDITLFAPVDGRRHFRGILESADKGMVGLRDSEEKLFSLPIDGMAKAKLDPEITF